MVLLISYDYWKVQVGQIEKNAIYPHRDSILNKLTMADIASSTVVRLWPLIDSNRSPVLNDAEKYRFKSLVYD